MQSDVVREAETLMQAGRSSLAGQSLQSRSASQPPYAGWLTQVSSVWDQKMMANRYRNNSKAHEDKDTKQKVIRKPYDLLIHNMTIHAL